MNRTLHIHIRVAVPVSMADTETPEARERVARRVVAALENDAIRDWIACRADLISVHAVEPAQPEGAEFGDPRAYARTAGGTDR